MKQSLRLGRVGGIPVGAHWSTLAVLVLVTGLVAGVLLPGAVEAVQRAYWTVGAAAAVLFLAGLLVHELAHALLASYLGIPVRSVTLFALGGVTEFEEPADTPGADFAVAVVGPLASLAVAAVFWLAMAGASALGAPLIIVVALVWLALINVVLAVFNLLPGAPLDGGRVLRAVLWRRSGDRQRADRLAARSGWSMGWGLAAAGVALAVLWGMWGGLWLVLVGWFLASSARAEAASSALRAGISGRTAGDIMTPRPQTIPSWISVDDFVSGFALRSHQTVFPVVDLEGRPTGVLTLESPRRIPVAVWPGTSAGEAASGLPPGHVAGLQDSAAAVLGNRPLDGELLAVVVEVGHVVGMVTTSDLSRILRQTPLRAEGTVTGSWKE